MRKTTHEIICPRCLAAGLRRWEELDRDQKMVFNRLPATARLAPDRKNRARFCIRCLFSDAEERETLA